jgi:hypothetical protein
MNLGPQRVYVYQWTVSKGRLLWLSGGAGAAAMGAEPLVASHLFLLAFDAEGRVLATATMPFRPFATVTRQAREWLASAGLAPQVQAPRIGDPAAPALVVYRPARAPCPFPTFDAETFKPSVAVDGTVVGDLAKGEYLVSLASAGSHVVTFDPLPAYRVEGQGDSAFVRDLQARRSPAAVSVAVEAGRPALVEAYVCTGTGRLEMRARVREAADAAAAVRDLAPAW